MSSLEKMMKALTKEIVEVDDFLDFNKAQEKLESDPTAHNIFLEFQERTQTIDVMRQSGIRTPPDQEEAFRQAQKNLRTNEVCADFLKAQYAATVTARKICNELSKATRIPFAGGGGGCCG